MAWVCSAPSTFGTTLVATCPKAFLGLVSPAVGNIRFPLITLKNTVTFLSSAMLFVVKLCVQSTRRPQGFHTPTTQIRLAITSNQVISLCKLLLCNSSQYGCHSVAVASPANFPRISKQITEQYHDFAQS